MTEYLTVQEYSKLYKIHENTVRRMIKDGKLAATKIGKGYKIPVEPGGIPVAQVGEATKEKQKEVADLELEVKRGKLISEKMRIDQEIKELEGQAIKAEDIARKEAELAEKEQNLVKLASDLADKEAQLGERETKLEERKKKYASLQAKERELNKRIAGIEEQEAELERKKDKTIKAAHAVVKLKKLAQKTKDELEQEGRRLKAEFYGLEQKQREFTDTVGQWRMARSDKERKAIADRLLGMRA